MLAKVLPLLFGRPTLRTWPAELAMLTLRLWTAAALALGSDLARLPLAGGLLLAAGFLTRPAALAIAGAMATSLLLPGSADAGLGALGAAGAPMWLPAPGALEARITQAAVIGVFAIVGSSRTGLDQLCWRRFILSEADAEIASFEKRRGTLEQAIRRTQ